MLQLAAAATAASAALFIFSLERAATSAARNCVGILNFETTAHHIFNVIHSRALNILDGNFVYDNIHAV